MDVVDVLLGEFEDALDVEELLTMEDVRTIAAKPEDVPFIAAEEPEALLEDLGTEEVVAEHKVDDPDVEAALATED